ncbi:hypothetical protein IX51_07290 [uncultured archaeon]|nr:hypothetical protein IX51_07290 [uncultured archaeon]HKJ97129.1 cbb3-type cytochrome c oxidase subunit I [Thermoplasmataceae archaeon]
MSTLSILIETTVILSVVFVVLAYLYYKLSTAKMSLSKAADAKGYEDSESYVTDMMAGKPRRLDWSILYMNDSKSIGLRFIFASLIFLFIGGAFGVMMRLSLTEPVPTIIQPEVYNVLLTEHATIMIYLFTVGMSLGLGFYLIPTQIKAVRDNMGNITSVAFWLYLVGGIFFVISRSAFRWYLYPPLSLQLAPYGAGSDAWLGILAMELIFIGISMASIVALKIIFLDRSKEVPLSRLPLFTWSIVFTLIMLISSDPPIMVALGMLFYDYFNPVFFTAGSHNVLLFTDLFWFWGHPIVYIAILPFFGIIYELLPRFSGTKIYSYNSGVFGLGLLMVLSELVWGHHLQNSGLGLNWDLFFSIASFAVVIPSAITVFNWIATLWTATSIRLTTPMILVLNGIIDFIIGGITGVMLANTSVNEILHGTYAVTSHFHYVFVGISLGITLAAFYVLFPTFSGGRTYDERLARWNAYLVAFGSLLMSTSWAIGGWLGMPRAVDGYFAWFQPYQVGAIIGGVIIGIGMLVFLYNIAVSWWKAPSTDMDNIIENPPEIPSDTSGGAIGGGR